jgi:hypothetical protein
LAPSTASRFFRRRADGSTDGNSARCRYTRVDHEPSLSVTDLAQLIAQGAVNAGPSPLSPVEDGDAVEVECVVSNDGLVTLGGHMLLAAEILGGRKIGIRIEATP